jgi:hypothetical protein
VHEHALMDDVMRKVDAVARENGASRVTRIGVRLAPGWGSAPIIGLVPPRAHRSG